MKKKCIAFLFVISLTASVITQNVFASGNILSNPGFEEVDGSFPSGWYSSYFMNTPEYVEFSVESNSAFTGNNSFSITNLVENDSKLTQNVSVKPGSVYKVSCRIKTENVLNPAGSANITLEVENPYGILTSKELSNTNNEWELLEFNVKIPDKTEGILKFTLRLGGQGVLNKGKAYFDDVSFEPVNDHDPSLGLYNFFIPSENDTSNSENTVNNNSSSSSNITLIFFILALVVIGLFVFVELRLKKNNKTESGSSGADGDDYDNYNHMDDADDDS